MATPTKTDPIEWAAKPLLAPFTFVGECAIILWDVIKNIFRRPIEFEETVNQMGFIGFHSIPIVALTTFSSGSVLGLYVSELVVRYGATAFAGATISLSIAREIGPVLAAIMVAARCGSAMAAQIATMAVTEQVDALRALSVNPTSYLVIPRLLAGILMTPILGLIGIYSGIIGGYLVSTELGNVPSGAFIRSIQQYSEPWDAIGGIVKCLVFGAIIAIVACQQGLRARGGAAGVGKSTTRAVVLSMVLVYVANFILAKVLY